MCNRLVIIIVRHFDCLRILQRKLNTLIAHQCCTVSPYFDDWVETNPNLQFSILVEVMNESKANARKNWTLDEVKLLWCPYGAETVEDTLAGVFIGKV